MDFSSTMNVTLPPVGGVSPHVTGSYNEPRPSGPHKVMCRPNGIGLRRHTNGLTYALFLAAAACAPADVSNRDLSGDRCPSEQFSVFLDKFSRDVQIQREFTQFPLRYSFAEDRLYGPELVTKMLPIDEVEFPIYPSQATIDTDGLQTIVETNNSSAKVLLKKPDTDYVLGYTFVKKDCWYLTEEYAETL